MNKGWGIWLVITFLILVFVGPKVANASIDVAPGGWTISGTGYDFSYVASGGNTPVLNRIVFSWNRLTAQRFPVFHYYRIQYSYQASINSSDCLNDSIWQDFSVADYGPDSVNPTISGQ